MPTAVSALFSAERLPEGAAAALDRAVLELIRTAAFDSWLNRYIMYGRRCANEGSVSEPSSEGRLSATQMRGIFVVCGALGAIAVGGACAESLARRLRRGPAALPVGLDEVGRA